MWQQYALIYHGPWSLANGWQSYGVFLAYYLEADVFPEASSLDFAFVGGLNFGAALLIATPVTQAVRRFGTHPPLIAGIVTQSAGYIAASFATRIWHLYLSQGLLVGIGMGLLFIPSVQCTSQWFDKKRSLANGINSAGSGVGGLIMSFAIGATITSVDFRWALRVCGIVTFVMNSMATMLIRNRNASIKPAQRGFDHRLLRRRPVLLLLSWAFLSMLGYMVVLYSLSAFAASIGLSHGQATSLTAILNAGTAVGRPMLGFLSDKTGRMEMAAMATAINAIVIFALWLPSKSYALTVVFSLISGGTIGTFWMTISPLCVEVAGLKELPSMLALCWLIVVLPTTFGEVIALEIRKRTALTEYLYPQIYSGLAYTLATMAIISLWLLQRNAKRQGKRLYD